MFRHRDLAIVLFSITSITLYLQLKYVFDVSREVSVIPLECALFIGGMYLVVDLVWGLFRGEFGSDILAGVSIITSAILGAYLAGTIVVLMLAGGRVLEKYAVSRASGALDALARRMPMKAHRRRGQQIEDVPVDQIHVGDTIAIFPHEVCPVDGTVIEGNGRMNEAYLTGEPFELSKAPGSDVISGAVNSETLLLICATRCVGDSRHAKVMQVMRQSVQQRPRARRLGDKLGALYTPFSLIIAIISWIISGDPMRFLAVLVVATPCPLIIAIPVAILGSLSLAAKRGIIVRDPASLELIDTCRTIILDKTGTLTRGRPSLTDIVLGINFDRTYVLNLVASLEQYSKHPLARAILQVAEDEKLPLFQAREVREPPGHGLQGNVDGHKIEITNRKHLSNKEMLPPISSGLECVALIDGLFAALFRFHDEPVSQSSSFIAHLGPSHRLDKVMIVSGDRKSEVQYLADRIGIKEIHAEKTPEEKVEITRQEVSRAPTVFLGDGINDAPALTTATVGIAFGPQSDVASEAAGIVVLENSLVKVDEAFHIGGRMRRIILQSALGGMFLSIIGMGFAAFGFLSPVLGALMQEVIDLASVLNSLRTSLIPRKLSDIDYRSA